MSKESLREAKMNEIREQMIHYKKQREEAVGNYATDNYLSYCNGRIDAYRYTLSILQED